jgi:hypothetical protein
MTRFERPERYGDMTFLAHCSQYVRRWRLTLRRQLRATDVRPARHGSQGSDKGNPRHSAPRRPGRGSPRLFSAQAKFKCLRSFVMILASWIFFAFI